MTATAPRANNAKPVSDIHEALRSVQDRNFLLTPKYQEQQMRANWEGAHPFLKQHHDKVLTRMALLGVPMFCHCAVRTKADQQAAFVKGNSNHDGSGRFAHEAYAYDMIHSTLGWNMPRQAWEVYAHVVEEVSRSTGIKTVNGFEWESPWDPAHTELLDWRKWRRNGDGTFALDRSDGSVWYVER